MDICLFMKAAFVAGTLAVLLGITLLESGVRERVCVPMIYAGVAVAAVSTVMIELGG